MRGSWGIWIGATLVAINALVLGQDLFAWRAAAPGVVTAFPVWPLLTLVFAVAYTAVATTVYVRGRRGSP
ncbi:hypothetical protein [Lichenicola sp.]|uniref:hypothetical protein n=1 Tax=Lichenicola sp. TaxID=2804529 RepID=UPI003AFFADEC